MIILTAFAIGLLSAGLRSAVCHALAGSLIVATFALAALFAAGNVSWLALVLAILAYNAGIAATIFATIVLAPHYEA